MLNVKQESCEYQLLKSFGLTRPGNRTLAYQLRGGLTTEPHTGNLSAYKVYFSACKVQT